MDTQKTIIKALSGFAIVYLIIIGLLSGALDFSIAGIGLIGLWVTSRLS